MKKHIPSIFAIILAFQFSVTGYSQKSNAGFNSITASDLESHLSFLASPLMKGRLNGSPEIDITANYLASQAKKAGLKPAGSGGYYASYIVTEKSMDADQSFIEISSGQGAPLKIDKPMYQLYPAGASDFDIEGSVIFAGYGIKADQYKYDDIDTLTLAGKIVIIMHRAPMTDDGKSSFGDQKWLGTTGLQMKLQALMFRRPRAVLIVSDPKSGFESMDMAIPGMTEYLKSSITLKGKKSQVMEIPGMPKIIFVHTSVADELLKGTGKTLAELQNEIDAGMKSKSFHIPGKTIRIKEVSKMTEKQFPNIAGIIEGSDPVLKNEVVIYSAHMDHVGGTGDNIKPGADDDASGCSALLELAEAFSSLPKKPLRSILFLWVSGEEVGLFGSEAYVTNPLIPLEKTVADLNLDMIGRVKGVADTTSETPMTGPGAVFLITDDQSKELNSIAEAAGKKNKLQLDYSLSGKNHPLMLFARSDHFNFVKHDIPILFFTSGLHTDYHKTGDTVDKIDFMKMELITRTLFDIGYQVASRKTRVVVDNPFSKWENNPFRQF